MIPTLGRICEAGRIKGGVEVRLRPGDRERLEGVVSDRKSPQHHAWRARIVLMTVGGAGTMAIRAATEKGKPTIWRWQARYMRDGADGLFRDAPQGRAFAAASPEQIAVVVGRTLHEDPPAATHWTLRSMAKASGLAPSTIHRISRECDQVQGALQLGRPRFHLLGEGRLAERVASVPVGGEWRTAA